MLWRICNNYIMILEEKTFFSFVHFLGSVENYLLSEAEREHQNIILQCCWLIKLPSLQDQQLKNDWSTRCWESFDINLHRGPRQLCNLIKSEGGSVVVIPALYIRFVGRILFLLKEKFPIKCFVDKMIVNIFHWKWL